MLILVESPQEKHDAENRLRQIFEAALSAKGQKRIGWRGGNITRRMFSTGEGEIWFAFMHLRDDSIPRYWNAFGIFDSIRWNQDITVEVNIPTTTNGNQVAAYFVKDTDTNQIYLVHSGRVGGSRRGIGKNALLAWLRQRPVRVVDSNGDERFGIVIGRLERSSIVERVSHFVRQVAQFKQDRDSGKLNTRKFREQIKEFERYRRESSGRRRGRRSPAVDYISYHGDVANALCEHRKQRKKLSEKIFNTPLIDLCVRRDGKITEIYEIKTSTERSDVYTAVGQLFLHSADAEHAKKFIVVPDGEKLPVGIEKALRRLAVKVTKYALGRNGTVRFH